MRRTKAEMEPLRAEVMRLHWARKSGVEIADELNMHRQQVSKIICAERRRWAAQRSDTDARLDESLERLEALDRRAWDEGNLRVVLDTRRAIVKMLEGADGAVAQTPVEIRIVRDDVI